MSVRATLANNLINLTTLKYDAYKFCFVSKLSYRNDTFMYFLLISIKIYNEETIIKNFITWLLTH